VPQRSYAHAAALGAIAAVCLAGCSAGADVDPERFEEAIRSHAVANLAPYGTVTDVGCRRFAVSSGGRRMGEDVARSYGATLYVDC
jgi:chromosome condensin MukBEF MukE localization factor